MLKKKKKPVPFLNFLEMVQPISRSTVLVAYSPADHYSHIRAVSTSILSYTITNHANYIKLPNPANLLKNTKSETFHLHYELLEAKRLGCAAKISALPLDFSFSDYK